MAERVTAKRLIARHKITVKQAYYRKTGDWFMELTEFPGALLDQHGVRIFGKSDYDRAINDGSIKRYESYVGRPQGTIRLPKGVSNHRGYVRFE